MSNDTVLRSMHDLGLAAWFGGSLMGATGMPSATAADHEAERAKRSADGWLAWSPVAAAAIGAHLVGGAGLIFTNRERHRRQQGVLMTTVVKATVTGAALAATAYEAKLGAQLRDLEAGTGPDFGTTVQESDQRVDRLRTRARWVGWSVPALTGAMIVMAALEGELQRPAPVVRGVVSDSLSRVSDGVSAAALQAKATVSERIRGVDTEELGDRAIDLRDALLDKAAPLVQDLKDVLMDKVHRAG